MESTVNNMACVFDKQEKALEWFERALAGREKALGLDHPSTQNSLRGLANLHNRARRTEQAHSLYDAQQFYFFHILIILSGLVVLFLYQ